MPEAFISKGPYTSEPRPCSGLVIGVDEFIFDVQQSGATARMVAAFDGSERPYEVHFEGVTFFSKADEQFAEEYQPQYVIEASRGKTADSHWLRVSGNEDSPLFEVHYRTASWQRLAWVEVGGRRFDGDATTLYGMPSWKVRVIAYGAVILFGAIFLLYSLWQQGFFRK